MQDFYTLLKETAQETDRQLDMLLSFPTKPVSCLLEAMRYAALAKGKRIRPFLVLSSADLFGINRAHAIRVAAAVEMVHCYSLVHDDLPAMDNDVLRRGQPTCHIRYDEATAILAGDALLTRAFEVLADEKTHPSPEVRIRLVLELAKAAGYAGMVEGQMLDLTIKDRSSTKEIKDDKTKILSEVMHLQRLKTSSLIAFSARSGAILAQASAPFHKALNDYAYDLGLAFQIQDDLLDLEGSMETVGKNVKKDDMAGKLTFISLLGAKKARKQARLLARQARQHLEIFKDKTEYLSQLASFAIERNI